MKDELAQALLGQVMGWDGADAADKLGVIQALARYKYDEYQRFLPGRRFVESLALWLEQFQEDEREAAYDFIQRRLIFISDAEFEHLSNSLYPYVVRRLIRERAGASLDSPTYRVTAVEASDAFRFLHRRSLFWGLSDGARIGSFRRSSHAISNYQVSAIHNPGDEARAKMLAALVSDLKGKVADKDLKFRLLFLIDDFSGSGMTLLRSGGGSVKGRIHEVAQLLKSDQRAETPMFAGRDTEIRVCLYVATQKALDHVRQQIEKYPDPPWSSPPEVAAIQILDEACRVRPGDEPALDKLLGKHYDAGLEDENTQVGQTSIEYGFASCGLPVVLTHNTPNNSLYLLWASSDALVPLFPRMERHR